MNRELATFETPLLNMEDEYVSEANWSFEDTKSMTWDAAGSFKKKLHMSEIRFNDIYADTMRNFTELDRYKYRQLQMGEESPREYVLKIIDYLKKYFPEEMDNKNDFDAIMERINTSIFGYDVIQPLIDNEETSDIKICGPSDIRVRVQGKAYRSNAFFLSEKDLYRFVDGLALRNKVDILSRPIITFTDNHDKNYILRFTISSPVICNTDYPYLHIRKVPKIKPDFKELIRRNMMNEKVAEYIKDRAKLSKGIVFAGPPGSGKSTALNAFIEHIPKTREVLVIQENDELFTEQSGFMFKHVTHGFGGEPVVTLEDLGKMALVEGCNEFIIGEVKGGEMRSAMTLLNAGGYSALTVHSNNARETLPKMADLVKYGSDYSYEEAKRMLKAFDTIIYMEGYKVREILEVAGYDDKVGDYIYIPIYKYREES